MKVETLLQSALNVLCLLVNAVLKGIHVLIVGLLSFPYALQLISEVRKIRTEIDYLRLLSFSLSLRNFSWEGCSWFAWGHIRVFRVKWKDLTIGVGDKESVWVKVVLDGLEVVVDVDDFSISDRIESDSDRSDGKRHHKDVEKENSESVWEMIKGIPRVSFHLANASCKFRRIEENEAVYDVILLNICSLAAKLNSIGTIGGSIDVKQMSLSTSENFKPFSLTSFHLSCERKSTERWYEELGMVVKTEEVDVDAKIGHLEIPIEYWTGIKDPSLIHFVKCIVCPGWLKDKRRDRSDLCSFEKSFQKRGKIIENINVEPKCEVHPPCCPHNVKISLTVACIAFTTCSVRYAVSSTIRSIRESSDDEYNGGATILGFVGIEIGWTFDALVRNCQGELKIDDIISMDMNDAVSCDTSQCVAQFSVSITNFQKGLDCKRRECLLTKMDCEDGYYDCFLPPSESSQCLNSLCVEGIVLPSTIYLPLPLVADTLYMKSELDSIFCCALNEMDHLKRSFAALPSSDCPLSKLKETRLKLSIVIQNLELFVLYPSVRVSEPTFSSHVPCLEEMPFRALGVVVADSNVQSASDVMKSQDEQVAIDVAIKRLEFQESEFPPSSLVRDCEGENHSMFRACDIQISFYLHFPCDNPSVPFSAHCFSDVLEHIVLPMRNSLCYRDWNEALTQQLNAFERNEKFETMRPILALCMLIEVKAVVKDIEFFVSASDLCVLGLFQNVFAKALAPFVNATLPQKGVLVDKQSFLLWHSFSLDVDHLRGVVSNARNRGQHISSKKGENQRSVSCAECAINHLNITSLNVGSVLSMLDITVGGDSTLSEMPVLSFYSWNNELATQEHVQADLLSVSASQSKIVTLLSVPSSFSILPSCSSNSRGMLFPSSSMSFTIDRVKVGVNNLAMTFVSDVLLAISQGCDISETHWSCSGSYLPQNCNYHPLSIAYPRQWRGSNVYGQCLELTCVRIDQLHVSLHQGRHDVAFVLGKSLRLHVATYPINGMNQINGKIRAISVSDMSEKCSWAKSVVSIANDDRVISDDMIMFHITSSSIDSVPLLIEFCIQNIRVTYLHRSIMTLVSYAFESVLNEINRYAVEAEKGGLGASSVHTSFSAISSFANKERKARIPSDIIEQVYENNQSDSISGSGAFRMGCTVFDSEIHIPTSSMGDDAIVLMSKLIQVYRNDPYCNNPCDSFLRGPFLHSVVTQKDIQKKDGKFDLNSKAFLWISDFDFHSQMHKGFENLNDNDCLSSSLLPNFKYVLEPSDLSTEATNPSDTLFQLSISSENSLICSWCGCHPIARDIALYIEFQQQTVAQAPDGMYAEVGASLGIRSEWPLKLYSISINMPVMDLCLSRGQYSAIMQLLQHNIGELQKAVPVSEYPLSKSIELKHTAYGKRIVDDSAPLSLAIEMNCADVRIHLIENTPDYYSKLFYSHKLKSELPRHLVEFSEEVSAKEKENYITNWFDNLDDNYPYGAAGKGIGNQSKDDINVDDTEYTLDGFSIPQWSYHYPLRDSTLRNDIIEYVDGDATLESIGFIYFNMLHFSFLLRHHGHAATIDIYSDDLCVTAGSCLNITLSNLFCSKKPPIEDDEENVHAGDPLYILHKFHEISPEYVLMRHNLSDEKNHDSLFHYKQTTVSNFRRCEAYFSRCVVFVHLPSLYDMLNFFQEITYLTFLREMECIHKIVRETKNWHELFTKSTKDEYLDSLAVLNFITSMDVEVYFRDSFVALPNYSYSPTSSLLCPPDTKVLCFELSQFAYLVAWRGFLEAGPGWTTTVYKLPVLSTFISNLTELCDESFLGNKGFESIVAPFELTFQSDYHVIPPDDVAQRHYDCLQKCFTLPELTSASDKNRESKACSDDVMMLTIFSSRNNALFSSAEDVNTDLEDSPIVLKLSLPDVIFLKSVVESLLASSNSYIIRPMVKEIYYPLFVSYHDIMHLPRYMEYYEHGSICGTNSNMMDETGYHAPVARTTAIIIQMSHVELQIRNNTYGIKIAKVHLNEPRFSFNQSRGMINVAASGELLVFLYNIKMGVYEGMVEKLRLTCICATDVTAGLNESAVSSLQNPNVDTQLNGTNEANQRTDSKLRFDVSFDPIEINICDSMIINLLSKLSLGDVITSSAANSPVYRAVNKLGLNLNCTFLFEQYDNEHRIVELLENDEIFAIDTRQSDFSSFRRTFKMGKDEDDEESHTVALAFTMGNQRYRSKESVPIDKEGVYSVVMRPSPVSSDSVIDNIFDQIVGTSDLVILVEMKIVDNEGTRELIFRSSVSLMNNTDSAVVLQASLLSRSLHQELKPEEEWYLPVDMVSRFTKLYMKLIPLKECVVLPLISNHINQVETGESPHLKTVPRRSRRSITTRSSISNSLHPNLLKECGNASEGGRHVSLDDASAYKLVYDSLYNFVGSSSVSWSTVGGFRRFAINDYSHSTFKACMVSLPCGDMAARSVSASYDMAEDRSSDMVEKQMDGSDYLWSSIIRPAPLNTRLVNHSDSEKRGGRSMPIQKSVNMKYPIENDTYENSEKEKARDSINSRDVKDGGNVFSGNLTKDETHEMTSLLSDSISHSIYPTRLQISPPVKLLNQICQPIIYRIREGDKTCSSNSTEGVLLSGHEVDIYINPLKQLYISIRMLNYKWSSWIKLQPFLTSVKEVDEEITSLRLYDKKKDKKMRVPSLSFSLCMHECSVRICCSMWLINRMGLTINYKEGGILSTTNDYKSAPVYLPHFGTQRIENAMVREDLPSQDVLPVEQTSRDEDSIDIPRVRSLPRGRTEHPKESSASNSPLPEKDELSVSFEKATLRRSASEKIPRTNNESLSSMGLSFTERKDMLGKNIDFASRASHIARARPSLGYQRPRFLDFVVHSPFDRRKTFALRVLSTATVANLCSEVITCVFGSGSHHARTTRAMLPNQKFPSAFTQGMDDNKTHHNVEDYYLFLRQDHEDNEECVPSTLASSASPKRRFFTLNRNKSKRSDKELTAEDLAMRKGLLEADETETKTSIAYGMNALPYLKLGRHSALPHGDCVETISEPRVLLCVHVSELCVLEQILDSEFDVMKKSAVAKLLNKRTELLFPFRHFKGEVPFNPAGMLGIFPSFNVCIPGETEWSDSVNVQKLDFSVTGAKHLRIDSGFSEKDGDHDKKNQNVVQQSRLEACGLSGTGSLHPYDISLLVHRGTNIYKNVYAVTLVPRTILSSKLPFALEIRQVILSETGELLETSKPFMLLPGSVQQYHHPLTSLQSQSPVVQLCQASPMKDEEDNLSFTWSCEVDITVIGVTNVRLYRPNKILNLQGETVGGTQVTTFSLQHMNWPPYRIDNRTSFQVRIKQRRKAKSSKMASGLIDYEFLSPYSSVPYCWDYCLNYSNEKKTLSIEFKQENDWVGLEIPLNEVGREDALSLRRDLPDLSQPLYEGSLESKYKWERSKVQEWKNCFCVAHHDVFYLFKSSTKKDVLAMINLVMPMQYSKKSNKSTRAMSCMSAEFATISRDTKKDWKISSIVAHKLGLASSRATSESIAAHYEDIRYFDINSIRRRMLILSEHLGLLNDAVTALRESDSDDDSEIDVQDDESSDAVGPLALALSSGIKLRLLVNHLSGSEIRLADIAAGLQAIGDAPNANYALHLVQQLLLRGFLRRGDRTETPSTQPSKENAAEFADAGPSPMRKRTTSVMYSEMSKEASIDAYITNLDLSDSSENVILNPPSLSYEVEMQGEQVERHLLASRQSVLDPIKADQKEADFRFSIKVGNSLHRFRSQTETDMWSWVISVRTCIEEAWVSLLCRSSKLHEDNGGGIHVLTKESLNTSANICVRTEGPMKVVELLEEVMSGETNKSSQPLKDMSSNKDTSSRNAALDSSSVHSYESGTGLSSSRRNSLSERGESIDNPDFVGVIEPALTAKNGQHERTLSDASSNVTDKSSSRYHRTGENSRAGSDSSSGTDLYVSVTCPSIGVSVIEAAAEPAELLYLCLRGTQVSYERSSSINSTSYAFTVQHLQVDNQLLNPLFPVSFRPRSKVQFEKSSNLDSSQKDQGPTSSQFLMLPGLPTQYYQSQNDNPSFPGDNSEPRFRYPTIHCFCRQRLSVDKSTTTYEELIADDQLDKDVSDTKKSDLLYFELFTAWVAPLELSIDEETFVRCLRVFLAIRGAATTKYKTKSSSKHKAISKNDSHGDNRRASAQAKGEQDEAYTFLLYSGVSSYDAYYMRSSAGKNIYFALLQLHPIDLVLSIRDTPDFSTVSKSDYAVSDMDYLTLAVRVDYGHIKLNALMINNVFGMTSFISDILSKHYTNAIIRQVMPLVGSTDMIEGSVGLLTNLGTGVYDLFYEPIDGLLGDEQTFMEGLSRGGRSLAAKTIGGTSAFTSKITGGLGKGMSVLTFDSKFQQRRNKERLKTAQSVSEGLKVGGMEFGRNVFDGVTGIVMEPCRGWKEGGGRGLGKGIAKGILGVAFKPAVGVLDLTSRTAEGIRNAAFNTKLEAGYMSVLGRLRLPRQFGRDGLIVPYRHFDSMIQLIVDRLTAPTRSLRYFAHHSFCFSRCQVSNRQMAAKRKRQKSIVRQNNMILSLENHSNSRANVQEDDMGCKLEIKGYRLSDAFFATISSDKILLFGVNLHMHGSSCKFNSSRNACGPLPAQLQGCQEVANVKLVWSCPTRCIGEFSTDSNGDVLLTINSSSPPVQYTGPWHHPAHPILHDPVLSDYYCFQEHLERCMGAGLAQVHPMHPDVSDSDCLCEEVSRKRTGIKSVVRSYSLHQYRIYKYVLYEFSEVALTSKMTHRVGSDKNELGDKTISELGDPSDIHSETSPDIVYNRDSSVGRFLQKCYPLSKNTISAKLKETEKEEYINRSRNMLLTLAVPLVNIRVLGPDMEDHHRFTIKICHKSASAKLSILQRPDPVVTSRLVNSQRDTLTLAFPDVETAQVWKVYLAETASRIGTEGVSDIVHPAGHIPQSSGSVRRSLVLPVGGYDVKKTEEIKIEIAKNLSLVQHINAND